MGLDRLDVADMIVALEEKTGKKVEIMEFLNVKTMADVYTLVAKYSK